VARLRPLIVPLLIIVVAAVLFEKRVRKEMVDFDVYRTAATRAVDAQPLYRAEDGHYQFKYLPAFALVMAPFALVDPEGAKVIWFALSVGLLTIYLRWTIRALPERRRPEWALALLTILFMAKFYSHELLLGQTNLLLGALLVGALLAVQVDLPRVAGVLVGLAVFVKPYALVLLPWLALTYGAVAGLSGVLVVIAGLVAPAVVYGWHGNAALLAGWYHTVTDSTAPNLLGADNISFAAMWAKWIGPGTAASVLATMSAGAAVALVAVVWTHRLRVAVPDFLEIAMLMLFVPLLSPQGWDYVLLLATPAVVVLMDRWPELDAGWKLYTGAALALMGLTIFDVMGRVLYARFMGLSLVTVAACSVAVSLWHLRQRQLA
jgi:hypothetical protein